ncbi:unnamed protein product [Withania somnifera]
MLVVKPYRRCLHSFTRQLNTLYPPPPSSATLFIERAVSILKGLDPISLNSMSSQFTPQYASSLLCQCQFDKPLVLKFINWARSRQSFNLQCKYISIHNFTRFKLYTTAQSPAEDDSYDSCKSSSVVFDLMVKSYSQLKMIDRAMNVFELAKSNGVSCNESFELAQKFYDDMVKSGASPNVYTYNIILWKRGYAKGGCLNNVVTYNTIIGSYCKTGKVDEAVKLLKLMQVRNLEPTVITYNAIINGLCREGRMNEIFEEKRGKGLIPDEVTYNTLANGYCRGNFLQALVLHSEMLRNELSPDVVTYTSLINSMYKTGNLHHAMELFDQLRAGGLYANERTYTTLIDGFSLQGFMNKAYKLLNEMISNGFSPSIVTYNALINGHCAVNRMEDALHVTQEMEQRRLVPDFVTYSTRISGFVETVSWKEHSVLSSGDVITYSSLIQGLCEQQSLTEACELFQEMLRVGLQPDQFTYNTLIAAYCANGDIKGFFPDVVTYNVLINGLNKQARTREAKCLMFKLLYEQSMPNSVTYDMLIESCKDLEFKSAIDLIKGFCMKGLLNEANRVFELMRQKHKKPNEVGYNLLIHGRSKGGNLHSVKIRFSGCRVHVQPQLRERLEHRQRMDEKLNQIIQSTLETCKLADGELAKVIV